MGIKQDIMDVCEFARLDIRYEDKVKKIEDWLESAYFPPDTDEEEEFMIEDGEEE